MTATSACGTGWGSDIDGGASSTSREAPRDRTRRIAPAFPPSVLHGPKVAVPHRSYFLCHGTTSELGDWGAAEMWPGRSRPGMPDPAFVWPADDAWCIANGVDPHFAGIGAETWAIDQLVADPHLDVLPADPCEDQPRYR